MNHAQWGDEVYDLYVLGILDADQAELIDAHLREGCDHCSAGLQEAQRVIAAMAGIANQVQPPAALRRRAGSVAPAKRPTSWVYTFAFLAAACVGLIVFSIWSAQQNVRLLNQLVNTRVERNELRSALKLMSQPGTKAVQFGNLENAPHGRVFVSAAGGVVFVGTGLPALPDTKTFELWLVPARGAPQAAGVFKANPNGVAVDVTAPKTNATGAAAVAVSVEPLGGSMAPTTKPFLIVPLS